MHLSRRWPGLFRRFLARRHLQRHYVRRWLLESANDDPRRRAGPAATAEVALREASRLDGDALLARWGSHPEGLDEAMARAARSRYGVNEIGREQPLPAWLHLWHCWRNPFSILLSVLAAVSAFTGDSRAALVIASMVALSTGLRFVQEGRSHRAADALKAMVGSRATVCRRGPGGQPVERELPPAELVPGDHVLLSAGDLVPADCRLLASKDLYLSESAMTGESLPVEKHAAALAGNAPVLAASNLVFAGTSVVSGSARALVVATGHGSFLGELASRVTAAQREPTAFESGVNSVSWLLLRFAALMVPVVLLVNGFGKGDWGEAALFALSVAVGLTPEMLPMIVTSTLARGAVELARRKVIVKRLDAIQNFGAMDLLCTDKTGTLTQDEVVLKRHTDAFGTPDEEVLRWAYLNSHYQTGLRNLLDRAVMAHSEMPQALRLAEEFRKVDEVPFDFERRRMSVVVAERGRGHVLICKGAFEEVLAVCSRVRDGTGDAELDVARTARVREAAHRLNREGLRLVAVATARDEGSRSVYGVQDERALTLVGFVAFFDPPKDSAAPALQALARHGLALKVLTGDSEVITAQVCRQVGLPAGEILVGADLDAMDDAGLAAAVARCAVFARLSPLHKERVVRALRAQGHVVGFLGDGINDAAALRAADIGISVDSAVDIAREAADIILLEKSLTVLDEGVMEGRRTFSNMLKYIRMTASSNFGNVLSVLFASIALPFLPMLPLHLLVQNLLYDVSQGAIPFDAVDEDLIRAPLRWDPDGIGRFMLWFGPVSSVFDLLTFALMWFAFHADSVARQALFQSGWFVVGLLTQALVVHTLRTPRLPWLGSRASPYLLWTTLAVCAVGIWLPMGPLAASLRLVPLPPAFWPALAALLAGYLLAAGLVKGAWVRRHGWQ